MQQVFPCPSGKFSPMVLGLFPQDFDRIELRTVRCQIYQDEAMIEEPFVNFFFVDIVVYRRIIQDNDDRFAVGVLHSQSINEFNNLRTFDRALMQSVYERIGGIVERAKYVHSLARNAGVGAMWHSQRRPCALYVGHGRHPRLVEKK